MSNLEESASQTPSLPDTPPVRDTTDSFELPTSPVYRRPRRFVPVPQTSVRMPSMRYETSLENTQPSSQVPTRKIPSQPSARMPSMRYETSLETIQPSSQVTTHNTSIQRSPRLSVSLPSMRYETSLERTPPSPQVPTPKHNTTGQQPPSPSPPWLEFKSTRTTQTPSRNTMKSSAPYKVLPPTEITSRLISDHIDDPTDEFPEEESLPLNCPNENDTYLRGEVTFSNISEEDEKVVKYTVYGNKDGYPNLRGVGKILSKVFNLLPHGNQFHNPVTVTLRTKKRLNFGSHVILYSSTGETEKPHWEIITVNNKADPRRRVLKITSTHVTFSMPTFCLVCVAEIDRIPLQGFEMYAKVFHVHVGILFEAEHITDDDYQKWLVQVRVLFSLEKFSDTSIRKVDKFEVAKDSILGDVRVHVHDIKDGWTLDDPENSWDDITVFQLEHGKRKEVMFSYFSENAKGNDTFLARVRLHQENARNDCEVILKDNSLLRNMLARTPLRSSSTVDNSYGVTLNGNGNVLNQASNSTTNGSVTPASDNATANAEHDVLYDDVQNGATSNIPTIVQDMISSSTQVLDSTFDRLIDDISFEINKSPTDDGVLQSLCDRLQFTMDLDGVQQRARDKHITPAKQILEEWKDKTGGNVRILKSVHRKYVD